MTLGALISCGEGEQPNSGGEEPSPETGGNTGQGTGGAEATGPMGGQSAGGSTGSTGGSTSCEKSDGIQQQRPALTEDGPFVHPGALSTASDLQRMKEKVAAGVEPWIGSWKQLTSNAHAQVSYQPNPQEKICAGNVCNGENYIRLAHDAAAAYQLSLRYHISGDVEYAKKAAEVVDTWADTLIAFTGDSNAGLRAALQGYQLAAAGELLRQYPEWDPSKLRKLLLDVVYPINSDFLVRHNGACEWNYWANWDLANMASIIAIGVFTDRRDIFNEAVEYFYEAGGTGGIMHAVTYVHPDGSGQWQESGRDQGHNTLGPMLMGVVCEIAWNQGVDLYGYAGNRFLKGSEYVAAYNLGHEVPYVPYVRIDDPTWGKCNQHTIVQDRISSGARGLKRAGFDLIHNHYANRLGIATPFTEPYAAAVRPEGGGGNYGGNSGGFDSLGFTTLTHSLEPFESLSAPSSLLPAIQGPQVTLSWSGSTNATAYVVKRATESCGPYTTLATVTPGMTYYVDPGLSRDQTYYYVVSAVGANGETFDSAEIAVQPDGQLKGTVIGVEGSFKIHGTHGSEWGTTRELAFDGSLQSFFVGPDKGGWTGWDLGEGVSAMVDGVSYAPRRRVNQAVVGSKFQGSNAPDFSSDVVDLFEVTEAPTEMELTTVSFAEKGPFRYLRYVAPSDGHGDVAEVQFHGDMSGREVPSKPEGVTAIPEESTVSLQWEPVSGAEQYRVKRARSAGGPFTVVASLPSVEFLDLKVEPGTEYFYVVTSLSRQGESSESELASAESL